MGRHSTIVLSFNGGEIGPTFDGRIDLEKYYSSCINLENFIPFPSGAITRRPGTYFVSETKTSAKKSRMVGFDFSTIQSYQLEFGHHYIRFYKDDGQIVETYAAWETGTEYGLGDLVTNGGNYYRCVIAHTSGTFNDDLTAVKWVETDGAGDVAYEIPSPYDEDDIFEIKMVQSADTMYLDHPSYPPKELTRTSHTEWALTNHVVKKLEAVAITGATKANPCVITSTAHGADTGDIVYISGVEGMTELNDRFFNITKIGDDSYSLDGIDSSGYGAWSSGGTGQPTWFGTDDNNPACCTFFEQRLVHASTNNGPQTMWFSRSADYLDFILNPEENDAALQYTIASDKVDRIRWMLGQDTLLMGTVGGTWKMSGALEEPLTQTSVTAKKLTSFGCADVDAEIANDVVLFVTKGNMTIRELVYSLAEDKMVANDLNMLANHIFEGDTEAESGIKELDYQQSPIPILWAVKNDGKLTGMTYERSQKVFGWFNFVTDGVIESVSLNSTDTTEDRIWMIVNRTIGGVTKRYVEYVKAIRIWHSILNYFGVDSGLTFDGGAETDITDITNANPAVVTSAGHGRANGEKVRIKEVEGMTEVNLGYINAYTVANKTDDTFELSGIDSREWGAYTKGGKVQQVANTLSGLDHLEGEYVDVVIDGAVHPQVKVESGTISLEWYGNLVHAGLHFDSSVEPMKIEFPPSTGSTSKAMKKRIHEIIAYFYETCLAKQGPNEDDADSIPFGTGSGNELFTGSKPITFKGDFDYDATVVVMQDQPLPMTLTAIAIKFVTGE